MIGLYFQPAQILAKRDSVLAKELAAGKLVDITHEASGVVGKGVVAFFEFVQFFYHGHRDDDIVILKPADRPVVMQDDVGVKNKYFSHSVGGYQSSPSWALSISETKMPFRAVLPLVSSSREPSAPEIWPRGK